MEFLAKHIEAILAGGAAFALFLLVYAIWKSLEAGAEEYTRRFTAKSAATLDEMFVFMPASFIMNMKMAAAAVGAGVGLLLGFGLPEAYMMIVPALLFAVPSFFAPDIFIGRAYHRRIYSFHQQLIDGLMVMSNGLKAGLSLPAAVQVMCDESPEPLAGEFRIVLQELNLGSSLERALDNLCRRMPIGDLRLFVASVNTVYSMGSGLTEVCERSVELIRERFRIERKIQTLTAEGRMQAAMLCSAPFALMLVLYFIDPNMVMTLFKTVPGMIILITVIVLDSIGFFIIRKITDIQV